MVKNLPASAFRHNRHGFNPWVGKIPWKRARQPTAVFLPGESHAKKSLVGYGLSVQFSSVAQSSPTLCDPMNYSISGFPVLHCLLEFAQTHVHGVSDAIQPSHPLLPPSPLALHPSQHQSLFQCVGSLHQVARVLELQLQHQSFQQIFRVDFL